MLKTEVRLQRYMSRISWTQALRATVFLQPLPLPHCPGRQAGSNFPNDLF